MKYISYSLALLLCTLCGSSTSCYNVDNHEITKLKRYFNTSSHANTVPEGDTLFIDMLKKWKVENDKIIQGQIISFYFKLFENVQDTQVRGAWTTIKEALITNFFKSNRNKTSDFEKLVNISMNDTVIQFRAVSELEQVIHNLDQNTSCRKQKRSQTQFRSRRAMK